MNFKILDNDKFQIYLNNLYYDPINFNDKNKIYAILKEVLERVVKYYKIKLKGFYNLNIYIDELFGTILIIEKEEDFNFLDSVDIKIKIYKNYKFKKEIIDKDLILDNKKAEYPVLKIVEKIKISI